MFNYEKLRRSLEIALAQELPQIRKVCGSLKTFPRHRITPCDDASVVATVATDGGENRLVLDPIRLQIIRVMDSERNEYFAGFIPMSFTVDEIHSFFFKSNDLLQWMVNVLGLAWDDLKPEGSYQKSNLMGTVRELLEWAALLRLMLQSRDRHIMVRDGLLRSVAIPLKVFETLREAFKEATLQEGHLLVGVAKRSTVLNYLSLAISLEDTLPKNEASYVDIPEEMEREAAPASYRWSWPRSMGTLCLARLTENAPVIYPIEIPSWEMDRKAEILACLAADARGSFPDPGYPWSLVKAHRFARIGGLEIEMIERMLIDKMKEHDPVLAEHLLSQMLMGRRISLPLAAEEDV